MRTNVACSSGDQHTLCRGKYLCMSALTAHTFSGSSFVMVIFLCVVRPQVTRA